MIILNVNELLDAARDISEASPGKLHPATLEALERALVNAADALAATLASAEGVTLHSVDNQPGFGGLCAAFMPGEAGETSETLAGYDQGGEW